jgi:Domain of unknown function DUF302
MTTHSSAVDHSDRRLLIALPETYDAAREHYETLVPAADPARFHDLTSWRAVLKLVKIQAPHGFMRYAQVDITPLMAQSPSPWKATQYLMGNHTIAERMFRHDPRVMLYAPLRTLIWQDGAGDAWFSVDQPSTQFRSFDTPEIDQVGVELDRKLALLFDALEMPVPVSLLNHEAEPRVTHP